MMEDDDEDDDEEEDVVDSGMQPDEVLTSFLENPQWDSYKFSYNLLSSDSSIRNGLSKDEWVERRRAWAKEAQPKEYRTEFSRELDPEQTTIDLPTSPVVGASAQRSEARFTPSRPAPIDRSLGTHEEGLPELKRYEVGWSISMSDTPLNETIEELPAATAVYPETRRHWFWTTYTLVQEEGEWRIQSMTDEVAMARILSSEELQQRVQTHARYLEEFSKQHNPRDLDEYSSNPDEISALEEARWRTGHILAYFDARIEKAALELANYELAAAYSLILNDFERSLVYFELMLQRFPARRAETLLQLGGIQIKFIRDLEDQLLLGGEDGLASHLSELAEANLRESLSLDDNYLGHLLLAQLLKYDDNRLDEAEEQLHKARALAPDEAAEAMVEHDMGTLAMIREDDEHALEHYRRVAEIHPVSPKAWADIADAESGLEHFEEAEASYRRAIALSPDDVNMYVVLGTMYMAYQQPDRFRELWEEGLRANPDSADFRFYLAMALAENGEFQRAQTLLEEAEQIDPDSEMAFMVSQMLNAFKTTKLPAVNPDEQLPVAQTPVPERKQLSGVKPPTKFSRARKRKKK
jgi:tetratricopeptide (TPR) repeat protein